MTILEFKLLNEQEQIDLLYHQGVFIAKSKERNIILFQIEAFYVEIHYLEYRKNIKNLICFSSTTLLDPYLEQINVENLV